MKDKKFKKKIRGLVLLLFLTAICLSTATYSWFSTNRTLYISELSIKVEAQGGVEISADAITWDTRITQADIKNANKTYPKSINQLPMSMEPVSTGKIVKNGKLDMYYGTTENYQDDYLLLSTKSVEKEGDDGKFMAFDIFLKSEIESRLYLTSEAGAYYKGLRPGIENSVRFAFLVEGNVLDKEDSKSAQDLNKATNENTYIWEPNYDRHTENGVKNAKDVYNIETSTTNGKQIPYDGLISEITKENKVFVGDANSKNYPKLFKPVNVDYLTKTENDENIEIFTIDRGITKIRIYIWLEGQDVDCENKSSIGNVEFNFQLTTNPS